MTGPFQRLVRHLYAGHGFDFVELGVPPAAQLSDLHDELHVQEDARDLCTHVHRWEVIDIHSSEVVSPPFAAEFDAEYWALRKLGMDAGKEHVVRRAIE